MNRPPKIAVSLGASFLGYATHAGFLNRLDELGVRPAHVAGSSAGAIAAGLFAAGLSRADIRRTVFDPALRRSFISKTRWGWHHLRSLFATGTPSLFDASGTISYLESIIPGRLIEELKSPSLTIALTDAGTMRPHLARSGPLVRAMVASCCMPALFSPLEFEGKTCFDGGIAHETPLDHWLHDDSVDMIVLHRVTHTRRRPRSVFPGNMIELVAKSHGCATDELLSCRQSLAEAAGKKLIVLETIHDPPSPFSSRRMPEYYEAGERQARRFFDSHLRPALDGPGDDL